MAVGPKIERETPLQQEGEQTNEEGDADMKARGLPRRSLASSRHQMVMKSQQRGQRCRENHGEDERQRQLAPRAPRDDKVFPDNRADAAKERMSREADRAP